MMKSTIERKWRIKEWLVRNSRNVSFLCSLSFILFLNPFLVFYDETKVQVKNLKKQDLEFLGILFILVLYESQLQSSSSVIMSFVSLTKSILVFVSLQPMTPFSSLYSWFLFWVSFSWQKRNKIWKRSQRKENDTGKRQNAILVRKRDTKFLRKEMRHESRDHKTEPCNFFRRNVSFKSRISHPTLMSSQWSV